MRHWSVIYPCTMATITQDVKASSLVYKVIENVVPSSVKIALIGHSHPLDQSFDDVIGGRLVALTANAHSPSLFRQHYDTETEGTRPVVRRALVATRDAHDQG